MDRKSKGPKALSTVFFSQKGQEMNFEDTIDERDDLYPGDSGYKLNWAILSVVTFPFWLAHKLSRRRKS